MRFHALILAALAVVTGGCESVRALSGEESKSAAARGAGVATVSMFYVGGAVKENYGVRQHSGQALIHYFEPTQITRTPIIMLPGLGLGGYIYISTPDEREGWALYFARRGHPVYVYDPVNTGPSGLSAGAKTLTTWNIDEIWPRFGFGAAPGEPYANTQYPVENIDQFYASWTTREPRRRMRTGGRSSGQSQAGIKGSDPNSAVLIELLERSGPAILMPHSWASRAVDGVIVEEAGLVAGVVMLETVTCPDETNLSSYAEQPFLSVYGDNIESRGQTSRYESCKSAVANLKSNGADADMIDLPAIGVSGNSHIFMQAKNSNVIAGRIAAWIDENISDRRHEGE